MKRCWQLGILNCSFVRQQHASLVVGMHSRPPEIRRKCIRWLTSSVKDAHSDQVQRMIVASIFRVGRDASVSCCSKPRVLPIRYVSADKRSKQVVSGKGEESGAKSSLRVPQSSIVEFNYSNHNRDNLNRLACPGCGVYMQDTNPKAPGFFKRPAVLDQPVKEEEALSEADKALVDDDEDEEDAAGSFKADSQEWQEMNWVLRDGKWEALEGEATEKDLDGFGPVGPGYGSWNEVGASNEEAKNAWKEKFNFNNKKDEPGLKEEKERVVVCARCHSLRSYGQVKDQSVENLLPEFDFEKAVGVRLMQAYGRRAVVVMVIDAVDFDGSFPRRVATLLAEADKKFTSSWKDGAAGNIPRLIVAATKIDLLPGEVSPVRLQHWVKKRVMAGGAPKPCGVHLVSSKNGWGLQAMVDQITQLAGPRGDVWIVGAQNAGKSSLINALSKVVGQKITPSAQLTEAPVPGTTVGIMKLEGILPAKARLYDTPGILHPHQVTTRLTPDEQKLVQARKELKPRTFRVKVGHTIYVGGLLRLDIVKIPTATIYVTVWASSLVPCHMGKTEKADETFEKHVGERLQPPLGKERFSELAKWMPRIVQVSGENWKASSVDIAVAGIGWLAIGLKGEATLSIWTYEGVSVTKREAMVRDFANVFERPGFSIDKGPLKAETKSGGGKEKTKNLVAQS